MGNKRSNSRFQKTLLCFIDGFDFNRINAENTPFLSRSLAKYPHVRVNAHPSSDHLPTILTGKHPHEHKMFDVILKTDPDRNSLTKRLFQLLPDFITTTLQCLRYMVTNSYELPTIPPKRRNQFQIMRTKSYKLKNDFNSLLKIGDFDTIFGIIGKERCNYLYTNSSVLNQNILEKFGRGDHDFEFLEIYTLDSLQQWNLDKPAKIDRYYREADIFLKDLYEKCHLNGVSLILLSDHGHDRVTETIDILNSLKNLGIKDEEYSYFIQFAMARFWFHNSIARNKALKMFSENSSMKVFSWQELESFNLHLQDSRYGEIFCMLKSGCIFFPDDFTQPVSDIISGLLDKKRMPRIFDPKYRGSHSFLKEYDSSKGFLLMFDDNFKASGSSINIVDVAPTLIDFIGYENPSTMSGNPAFTRT